MTEMNPTIKVVVEVRGRVVMQREYRVNDWDTIYGMNEDIAKALANVGDDDA